MLTHPSLLLLLLVSAGHCSKLTRPHSPTRDAREILGGMSDRYDYDYDWEIFLFSGGPRGWSISTISSSSTSSLLNTTSLLHTHHPDCPQCQAWPPPAGGPVWPRVCPRCCRPGVWLRWADLLLPLQAAARGLQEGVGHHCSGPRTLPAQLLGGGARWDTVLMLIQMIRTLA